VEAQIADLEGRRAILTKEYEAYLVALDGYLRRTGRQVTDQPDWANILKEKTHKQKIVTLALHRGGTSKVSEVTDLLYGVGLIKSKNRTNAYTIVQVMHSELAEDGVIERISPGEYKLVDAQQSLPGVN
jgi:hypothetical protein